MLSEVKKVIKRLLKAIYQRVFPRMYQTRSTAAPITFKTLFIQKVMGFNRHAYWPTHHSSVISNPQNILIGIGTAPGLSPGCYIQGVGKLYIGDYTIIAPNVGIISANHDLYDYRIHKEGLTRIGNYCWIGMNSTILPNVELGDHTIVAANTVVTKSFVEGYCVIAGNPARVIKRLDPERVVRYENKYKYYGYISEQNFSSFRKKYLKV